MVRGILRCLLGGYLTLNPAEIHFSYGACGKPALAGCLAGRLRFNLSHAGNWAAYAICVDREVGIDIEPLRNDIPWRQLAPLVFSLHEQSELAKVPIQEKTAAFLRGWTRKEAYIKGCGEGLSLALESFDVPLGALTAPCQVKSPLIAKVPLREWWLYPIKFSKDVTATLAVEGHPIPVKVYRWSYAQLVLLGSQVNPDAFESRVHAQCHSNISMFS
jgi:4'-phosphopantetheinyl transferase